MEYSDAYLREQLPGDNPPEEYVPRDVTRQMAGWIERGPFEDRALLARSMRWTYAIFSELGIGNIAWESGPGAWELLLLSAWNPAAVVVGLYDAQREAPGFGLSVEVPPIPGAAPFAVVARLHFPRLKWTFPVAFRQVMPELHTAPNPANATAACWARCNQNQSWGIITAGHAVGTTAAGIPVPLANGAVGTSHRCFWQPIDAAFVLTAAPTMAPAHLPSVTFPAAGLPVTVECRNGAQSRTIVSACNALGFYRTRQFPVLFFLDQPCSPGDSGSLVRLGTGEACGIYNGAQPSPSNGGTSGRALNFDQAMFTLDTTAYL